MVRRWLNGPRPDFVALVLAAGLSALAGILAIVRELARILPNRDVPVRVDLDGVAHELVLDGAVTAEATEAVVRVSGLDAVPLALVLAAAVLPPVTILVVAGCFALLGWSFFRGEFFTRGNLVAVNAAAAVLVVTSLLIPSLQGTAGNSALASAGAGTGQAVVLGIDMRLLLAGFLLGAVGYAFQRGSRFKRDTEGLV